MTAVKSFYRRLMDVLFWFALVYYAYGGTNIGGKERFTYINDVFTFVAVFYAFGRLFLEVRFRDTTFGGSFDSAFDAGIRFIKTRSFKHLAGTNTAGRILLVFAIYFIVLFFAVPVINHYFFGNSTFDFGVIENTIYNGSRTGRFFTYFLIREDQPASYFPNNHLNFGLIFFALIYKVLPRAEVLFLFQSLALVSAMIPLYKLADRYLPADLPRWAPLVAYWFFDPIHRINMWDYHEAPFMIPFALWALYFIESGRLRWALVNMFLMAMWREDAWLAFGGMGLYAAIRTKKWPLFLPLSIAAFFVFPLHGLLFNKVNNLHEVYSYLGRDFNSAVNTIMGDPKALLNAMISNRNYYYRLILLVGGPLFLFGGFKIIPILPNLAQLSLATWPGMIQFNTHYPALYTGPLFFALIFGWKNLYEFLDKRNVSKNFIIKIFALSLSISVTQLYMTEAGALTKKFSFIETKKCLDDMLAAVPPGVPLIATDPLAIRLAKREWITMPIKWIHLNQADWNKVDLTRAECLVSLDKTQLDLGMRGRFAPRPWTIVKEGCGLYIAVRPPGVPAPAGEKK